MKQIRIGRSEDNDIVIKNPKVSGRHCTLQEVSPSVFVVEDLDSSGGTFLDGQRVKRAAIGPGNELRLADQVLDTALLLSVFSQNDFQTATDYSLLIKKKGEYAKQEQVFADFVSLKEVYENYQAKKKKALRDSTLKSTGVKAGLALIPMIGNSLAALAGGVGQSLQEKMMEMNEQFKKDYACPACFKSLGEEPFENLDKRGTCLYCKAKWK